MFFSWRYSVVMILVFGLLSFMKFNTAAQQIQPAPTFEYESVAEFKIDDYLSGITWNPSGDSIAVSGAKGLYLYKANFGLIQAVKFDDKAYVFSTVWSPDGSRTASLLSNGMIYVRSFESGLIISSWKIIGFPITIDWSSDGSNIAVSTASGEVLVFDVVSGHEVNILGIEHFSSVGSLDWNPDNRRIAFEGVQDTNVFYIWDTLTRQPIDRIRVSTGIGSWNPDGIRLAVRDWLPNKLPSDLPSLGIIYIWRMNQKLELTRVITDVIGGQESRAVSLQWHPQGRLLASYSEDRKIRIWDTETGLMLAELSAGKSPGVPALNALAWNFDGTRLGSVGDDGVVRIWRTKIGGAANGNH